MHVFRSIRLETHIHTQYCARTVAGAATASAIGSNRKTSDFTSLRASSLARMGERRKEKERERDKDRGSLYERITGAFMADDHMAAGRIPLRRGYITRSHITQYGVNKS